MGSVPSKLSLRHIPGLTLCQTYDDPTEINLVCCLFFVMMWFFIKFICFLQCTDKPEILGCIENDQEDGFFQDRLLYIVFSITLFWSTSGYCLSNEETSRFRDPNNWQIRSKMNQTQPVVPVVWTCVLFPRHTVWIRAVKWKWHGSNVGIKLFFLSW